MPLVSIIIATQNNENTIGKAVASAQNQTVQDIEIIIVDDASTDSTYDHVARLAAGDRRIKCVRLRQNLGPSGARNAALGHATGEWISILDGDDWYEPNRLEVLLRAAYDYKADLVADNLKIYDRSLQCSNLRTYHGTKAIKVVPLTAKTFFDGDNPRMTYNNTGFIQPLVSRMFLIKHEIRYNTSYLVGEDSFFVAEILLHGARGFIVPGAFYNYVYPISLTTGKAWPHSHSVRHYNVEDLCRSCNELLQKYGTAMTMDVRHALLRRRRLYARSANFEKMRDGLRRRQFARTAWIAFSQPAVLVLVGHKFVALLAKNIRGLVMGLK